MGSKVNVFLALFLCMVLLHSSSSEVAARQLTQVPAAGGLSHISSKEAAQTHEEHLPTYGGPPCPPYIGC
ncbi:hypothetical protein ACS0TY_014197 [Phlomoides rotata]